MIKILLIGNSGVGKSSILMQYSDKKFVHNYYNTIGVDYVKSKVILEDQVHEYQRTQNQIANSTSL